jgi:hypothetical protein
MMKKTASFSLVLTTAVMLALASCGGGSKNHQVADDVDEQPTKVFLNEDSTLYGLCGEGSAMNTLQLLTDTGDTLTLSTLDAQEQNHVLGGYNVGDRLAVLTDRKRTKATLVINESTLLGNWVMPNPLDGSDETGISIREGGVAESIDQSVIIYRTWRINNGLLELISTREGGVDEEEVNLYEILSLGNDSLVFKTVGKPRDEEETFEYSRQQIHEHVDKVKLEESSFEDFRI